MMTRLAPCSAGGTTFAQSTALEKYRLGLTLMADAETIRADAETIRRATSLAGGVQG